MKKRKIRRLPARNRKRRPKAAPRKVPPRLPLLVAKLGRRRPTGKQTVGRCPFLTRVNLPSLVPVLPRLIVIPTPAAVRVMTRRDYKRKAEENPPYPPPKEKLVLRSKSVERNQQPQQQQRQQPAKLQPTRKLQQQQLSAKLLCPLEPHVQLIRLQLPLKENTLHNLMHPKVVPPAAAPKTNQQQHPTRLHPYHPPSNLSRQVREALRLQSQTPVPHLAPPPAPPPRTKCLTIGPELLTCSDREIILRMPLALVK